MDTPESFLATLVQSTGGTGNYTERRALLGSSDFESRLFGSCTAATLSRLTCLLTSDLPASLAEPVCIAVRNLCAIAEGCEALLASGAVPAVHAVLYSHLSSPAVSLRAMAALYNLSSHDCNDESGKQQAVAAGAVGTAAAVLATHAASAALAEEACSLLYKLTFDCRAGKLACLAADAVPLLVAALRTHSTNSAVKVQACKALWSLATLPPGQDACVAGGAIPALLRTLSTHSAGSSDSEGTDSSSAVCDAACHAVKNLAWRSPSHRSALVAAGAVPLLVLAARDWRTGAEASGALGRLGYDRDGILQQEYNT